MLTISIVSVLTIVIGFVCYINKLKFMKIIPIQKSERICEHSWHVLVNEQQDNERLIIVECIKCGAMSKDIIGKCHHEWGSPEDIVGYSKYHIATKPIIQVAEQLFKYSKSFSKFDKLINTITQKWFDDDKDNSGNIFESSLVRTKTCLKCGEVLLIEVSNSSPLSAFYVASSRTVQTQENQDIS